MIQVTDADIKELKDLIQGLDKKIEGLDRKMEIGFANIETQFARLDGKIDVLDAKFEERTRLGFWGFVFRAVVISVLAGVALLFVRYLFPALANP